MYKKSMSIVVRFQKEGIHCYPAAATNPKLKDVEFLAHPHRHIFHFEVSIEVRHEDREIEFIQFKRWLESLYKEDVLQLNYKSCEMISDELADTINDKYPNRMLSIGVFEDGENGSMTTYKP